MRSLLFVYMIFRIATTRVTGFILKISKADLFDSAPTNLSHFFCSIDRASSAPALVQLLTGFSVDQILAGKAYAPVSEKDIAMTVIFLNEYVKSTQFIDKQSFDQLVRIVKEGSELCRKNNMEKQKISNPNPSCTRNPYGSLLNFYTLASIPYLGESYHRLGRSFPLSKEDLNYLDPSPLSQLSLGSFWSYAPPMNFERLPDFVLESILQRAISDPQLGPIKDICRVPLHKCNLSTATMFLHLFPTCLSSIQSTKSTKKRLASIAFPIELSTPNFMFTMLLQNWTIHFGYSPISNPTLYKFQPDYNLIEQFISWLFDTVANQFLLSPQHDRGGEVVIFTSDLQHSALLFLFHIVCYRAELDPNMSRIFAKHSIKVKKKLFPPTLLTETLQNLNPAESLAALWTMANFIDDSAVTSSRYRLVLLHIELFCSQIFPNHNSYGIENRIAELSKLIATQKGPSVLDLTNFFEYYSKIQSRISLFYQRAILSLLSVALTENRQFRDSISGSSCLSHEHFARLGLENKLTFFRNYARFMLPKIPGRKEPKLPFFKFQTKFLNSALDLSLFNQCSVTLKLDKAVRLLHYRGDEEREFISFSLKYLLSQWFVISKSNTDDLVGSLASAVSNLTLSMSRPILHPTTYMPNFALLHPFVWKLLAQILKRAFVNGQCIVYRFDQNFLGFIDAVQKGWRIDPLMKNDFVQLFKSQVKDNNAFKVFKLLAFELKSYNLNKSQDFQEYMKKLKMFQFIPSDKYSTDNDFFIVIQKGVLAFVDEFKTLHQELDKSLKISTLIESLYCK